MTQSVHLLLRAVGCLTIGLGSLAWQTSPAADRMSALSSLTAAERAFAAATAEIGVRNGFLTFFADDAVAIDADGGEGGVRLIPARGRLVSNPQPAWPLTTRLTWAPDTGQVSADGATGWLVGPYVNQDRSTGAVVGQGAYFSVWRRQTDGTWKVWLDQGVSLPEVWTNVETFRPAVEPEAGVVDESVTDVEARLRDAPSEWASRLAPSVRLHRDGRLPIVGADAVASWRTRTWTVVRERVVTTEVAGSRDMAVTLGGYTATGPAGDERGIFARVWQRGHEGHWEIVFETSRPA